MRQRIVRDKLVTFRGITVSSFETTRKSAGGSTPNLGLRWESAPTERDRGIRGNHEEGTPVT